MNRKERYCEAVEWIRSGSMKCEEYYFLNKAYAPWNWLGLYFCSWN